jgi:hypothetical protein
MGADSLVTQVFIPAAGKGTRVQSDGIQLAKPMRSIGNKPLITRIMDIYPKHTRFLVALGFQGEWVRQVAELTAQLNDQEIDFVWTQSWNSNNQGLTHTLLDAEPKLENQFIFHAVDSIVNSDSINKIQQRQRTSILVAEPKFKGTYRTIKNGYWEKTEIEGHFGSLAYVGVSKINANSQFWNALHEQSNANCEGGETIGINPENCEIVRMEAKHWLDCGSIEGIRLASTKHQTSDVILERNDEAIWTIQNRMIKFHTSVKFIENRVTRAESLYPYVPEVKHDSANIYSYERVNGETLSKAPSSSFKEFLEFCIRFWTFNTKNLEIYDCKKKYIEFYQEKTKNRIQEFLNLYPNYNVTEINKVNVIALDELLSKINWDDLTNIDLGRVHGDLHPDNVIYSDHGSKFSLLDWRQDLAGDVAAAGDIYYDLAKINHGLIVDHEKVSRNEFMVSISDNHAKIQMEMTEKKQKWKNEFDQFVKQRQFDVNKIELLTALIFLNIAVLHHKPYSQFLFVLGHEMLDKQMFEKK